MMKLAVYSVSLPEYTIEESVALAKEMGYDGIEWRVDRVGAANSASDWFPKNMDAETKYNYRYWLDNKSTLDVDNILEDALKAKKFCDEAGIEIVNLATSLGADYERLEKVLAACQAIGCKSIRAFMANYDHKKSFADQLDELHKMMHTAEPMLKKYGVKLLTETHHRTMISSASAGVQVLEGFDPNYFGLIFDPGNMVFEGYEDYHKGFDLLGEYLAHVHIKNGIFVEDGVDEFGAAKWSEGWATLQKGTANLRYLVESLVKVGYDGVLSVEDFSNEMPTREKLENNIAYLRRLVDAATKKS